MGGESKIRTSEGKQLDPVQKRGGAHHGGKKTRNPTGGWIRDRLQYTTKGGASRLGKRIKVCQKKKIQREKAKDSSGERQKNRRGNRKRPNRQRERGRAEGSGAEVLTSTKKS